MSLEYKADLREATEYIQKQYSEKPEIGIILGTGLGGLAKEIVEEKVIPYNFIPHFPISTVESHFGKLIFGSLGNKKVVAMQGRFHFYEGYSPQEITFPVRVLGMLGVETLLISNAGGGLNLDYQNGDLVILDDHINFQYENPLRGISDPDFGSRFPDMSEPYDKKLSLRAQEIADEKGYRAHQGVYVSVPGPSLETRAEYRFLRMIGADVVGMSTVPEVIVANQMNMRVCAVSVITDMCDPDNLQKISIEHILATAEEAEPRLTDIMAELIRGL